MFEKTINDFVDSLKRDKFTDERVADVKERLGWKFSNTEFYIIGNDELFGILDRYYEARKALEDMLDKDESNNLLDPVLPETGEVRILSYELKKTKRIAALKNLIERLTNDLNKLEGTK